jgi:hypothetical protein
LPLSLAATVPRVSGGSSAGCPGLASLRPAHRRRSPSPCRPSATIHGHVTDRLFVPVGLAPAHLTPLPPHRIYRVSAPICPSATIPFQLPSPSAGWTFPPLSFS